METGEESAYREFHAHYFRRLHRYLLVLCSGREPLAQDALLETWRRVAKHVRVFDDETIFWNWLVAIARSALTDEARRDRRYAASIERFRLHAATEREAGRDGDVLKIRLEKQLQLLPPDDRDLIAWKYFDRLSVATIARRLNTTESAVESRLVRVRRRLKFAVLADLDHEATP